VVHILEFLCIFICYLYLKSKLAYTTERRTKTEDRQGADEEDDSMTAGKKGRRRRVKKQDGDAAASAEDGSNLNSSR
jgi:hypothetical protein